MISIYLFTKKKVNLFSSSNLIQFKKKKVIYTYCFKKIYYKISIWQQKLFLLAFTINEFIFLNYLEYIYIYIYIYNFI